MDNQFVEVARYNFPTDPGFILFTIELEDAGIEYICPERIQLENQPFLSIGLGGLRVLVNSEDVQAASEILANLKSEATADETAEPDAADMEIAQRYAQEERTNKALGIGCLLFFLMIAFALLIPYLM